MASDPTKCAECGRQFTEGDILDALTEGIYCLPCRGVSLGGVLYQEAAGLLNARRKARKVYGRFKSEEKRLEIMVGPVKCEVIHGESRPRAGGVEA